MEKGFESWFRNQQIDWQSPNPNSSKPSACQEPCGWFYGLPRCRQGFTPMTKEQLPVISPNEDGEKKGTQKKFLVFDQTGDQTTLIYSSGVGPDPIRYHFPSTDNPKPQCGSYALHHNEHIEENDSRSEMHEDTEELNALLYSDDDFDYSENEETSTGHYPGSVGQKRVNESGEEEEVASSAGPTKRCKREDGGNIVNSLEDNASSGKSGVNCSGNGGIGVFEEELRKEKMKETINLLRNLIPGDKNGKTALVVIDEAIHYLRSLKGQFGNLTWGCDEDEELGIKLKALLRELGTHQGNLKCSLER